MAAKKKTGKRTKKAKTMTSPRSGSTIPTGGHPGNSGGKPGRSGRIPNKIKQLAREAIDKHELVEVAAKIATGEEADKASDQVAAIRLLLEYGYGKPDQRLDIGAEVTHRHDLSQLTDSELATLEKLSRKVREKEVVH